MIFHKIKCPVKYKTNCRSLFSVAELITALRGFMKPGLGPQSLHSPGKYFYVQATHGTTLLPSVCGRPPPQATGHRAGPPEKLHNSGFPRHYSWKPILNAHLSFLHLLFPPFGIFSTQGSLNFSVFNVSLSSALCVCCSLYVEWHLLLLLTYPLPSLL